MKKYILIRIVLAVLTLFLFFTFIYNILEFSHQVRWTRAFTKTELLHQTFDNYKLLVQSIIKDFNWGFTRDGEEAWTVVKEYIPLSIRINLIAFLLYLFLGVLLGITSAVYKGSLYDKFVTSFTMFLGSIPTLVWIMVLVIIFGYHYRNLPSAWNMTLPFKNGELLKYILPVTALSLEPIAKITRLVRAELIDTFQSEYILLCKAKGLKRRQIILRHNFKHILVILLPELSIIFLYALLNSFFIEDVYNIQGVARLFMDNIISYDDANGFSYVNVDVNLITVISMYVVTFTTVMVLITDILMGIIDPRIKINGKKYNK